MWAKQMGRWGHELIEDMLREHLEAEADVLCDKGVNLAIVGQDLVDKGHNVVVVADIALVGLDLDAVLLGNVLGCLVSLGVRVEEDGYIGTSAGNGLGDGET